MSATYSFGKPIRVTLQQVAEGPLTTELSDVVARRMGIIWRRVDPTLDLNKVESLYKEMDGVSHFFQHSAIVYVPVAGIEDFSLTPLDNDNTSEE